MFENDQVFHLLNLFQYCYNARGKSLMCVARRDTVEPFCVSFKFEIGKYFNKLQNNVKFAVT